MLEVRLREAFGGEGITIIICMDRNPRLQIIIQLSELETTKRFFNADIEQLHKVYSGIGSHLFCFPCYFSI